MIAVNKIDMLSGSGAAAQKLLKAPVVPVAPQDSAAFASLMAQARAETAQPAAPATVTAVASTASTTAAPAAAQRVTMGDIILRGLERVGGEVSSAWNEIPSAVGAGPSSPAEVLGLQAKMMQMSLACELVGKVAAKATQGIDQLVHTQ